MYNSYTLKEKIKKLSNLELYLNGIKCKKYEDNSVLDWFEENVDYKHWYFGHYHLDVKITNKKTALYNDIIEIK